MKRLPEATLVNAFRVEPPDPGSYEGWLPVDDEAESDPEPSGRVSLEDFISELLRDDDDDPGPDVGQASGVGQAGRHGGVRVGMGSPGVVKRSEG